MKAVVDTNVIAYFLLGTPRYSSEARLFFETLEEGLSPVSWQAELANVIWMAIRQDVIPPQEGPGRLRLAARLGLISIPIETLWQGALVRAVHSGVAVYDTLFVELAQREQVSLATFDTSLLNTFPEIAKRPRKLT